MISLKQVSGIDDILTVAELADVIWHEHFVSIIGAQQVDYMLTQFQSPQAITSQIENGFEYYLVSQDHGYAGYLGIIPDQPGKKMMISKIYIRREDRSSGHGSFLLDFVQQQCINRGLETIWLTVNRYNASTIEWYRRKGFVITNEVKKDIGEGFYMDDFIMELTVGNTDKTD